MKRLIYCFIAAAILQFGFIPLAGAVNGTYGINDIVPAHTAVSSSLAGGSEVPKNRTPEKEVDISALASADEDASYNFRGKIDPFKPFIQYEPLDFNPEPGKDCPQITQLQQYDLSQLKFTGVVLAETGNRGLIIAASDKGYIIKEGDYIGNSCGRVRKIEKDRIVVSEQRENRVKAMSMQLKEIFIQGFADQENKF